MPSVSVQVTTTNDGARITRISHPLATIWVGRETHENVSYFYGGTRLISHSIADATAESALVRLMYDESCVKNLLINYGINEGFLDDLRDELPSGFLQSHVRAARCVIRPRSSAIAASLKDPKHPKNASALKALLESIGRTLNEIEPQIRLTPDFGRYAGLADILHQYTPNVLGISCDRGGCGGKSSYSVTGVLAGIEKTGSSPPSSSVTCIGAAGAMGSLILAHFIARRTVDLGACDLRFDRSPFEVVPGGCTHLASAPRVFTETCLSRGGLIVTTAVGDELARSSWNVIPAGTVLLLAQNLALPAGEGGIALARALAQNGVLVIPGQLLTLGGALTARLEWYWRQIPGNPPFNKQLAHNTVHKLVTVLIAKVLEAANRSGMTPYEAMRHLIPDVRQVN